MGRIEKERLEEQEKACKKATRRDRKNERERKRGRGREKERGTGRKKGKNR
jgi:hypothetical protein